MIYMYVKQSIYLSIYICIYISLQITSLELDLSSANEALNERVHTLTDQTAALDDRQHMLQHSNTRISELEDMQLILDKQVNMCNVMMTRQTSKS